MAASGTLLTPAELFEFYQILPTAEEFDGKRPAALARLTEWEAMHRSLGAREPARSALGYLRFAWRDKLLERSPP